jgi:hypothetical protein
MKEEYEKAQKKYFDLAEKFDNAKKPSDDLIADLNMAERDFMIVKDAWENKLKRISRSAKAGANPLMAAIGGGGAKLKQTETKDSSGPKTTGGSKDKRKKSALTLEMEARLASMRQSKKESPEEYAKRLSGGRKKTKKKKVTKEVRQERGENTKTNTKTKKKKTKTKEDRQNDGEQTWRKYDLATQKEKRALFKKDPKTFKAKHKNIYEFLKAYDD